MEQLISFQTKALIIALKGSKEFNMTNIHRKQAMIQASSSENRPTVQSTY